MASSNKMQKRLRVEFDKGMGDSNLVEGNVCVFELIRLRALRAFIEVHSSLKYIQGPVRICQSLMFRPEG